MGISRFRIPHNACRQIYPRVVDEIAFHYARRLRSPRIYQPRNRRHCLGKLFKMRCAGTPCKACIAC